REHPGPHPHADHGDRARNGQGSVRRGPGFSRLVAGPDVRGQRGDPGVARQAPMMSAAALYSLEGLTHGYGERAVLHIDRLEIAEGEVLCLVGPTGAGKSTLLRLLAGLERPAAGRLRFGACQLDERDLSLATQRRITLVFQRPLL